MMGDAHIGPTVYVGPECIPRGDFGIYFKLYAASAGTQKL